MRIMLTVMADIMVLLVALLAVTEYRALKGRATFTEPFTDRLLACGAIRSEDRATILRQDRLIHVIGLILCVAVWIMLSAFFAGLSGWALFPVAAAALLMLLKPDMEENNETREQYYRLHGKYIDKAKYHDYLTQNRSAGQP